MNRKHSIITVLVAVLLVFVIGATWVVAQSDGVIQACVNPAGQPRIIDSEAECKRNETYLNWNISGPQGPPGPQGEQGLPGPQGEQGSPGVLGFYAVEKTLEFDYDPISVSFSVECDGGDVVTGGGHRIEGADNIAVHRSYPRDFYPGGDGDGNADAWSALLSFDLPAGRTARMTVHAICADVTP